MNLQYFCVCYDSDVIMRSCAIYISCSWSISRWQLYILGSLLFEGAEDFFLSFTTDLSRINELSSAEQIYQTNHITCDAVKLLCCLLQCYLRLSLYHIITRYIRYVQHVYCHSEEFNVAQNYSTVNRSNWNYTDPGIGKENKKLPKTSIPPPPHRGLQ